MEQIKEGHKITLKQGQLRSGSGAYPYAICVQTQPQIVLISPEGDMRWSTTIEKENLQIIGTANNKEMDTAMKRYNNDLKTNPQIAIPKNTKIPKWFK